MNKTAFLIPVYRHGATLENVVKSLLKYGFPIIVVDDGNTEPDKSQIAAVAEKYPLVNLVVCKKNGGKGRAMTQGIKKAHELGITHALQVDADGQHDISRVDFFLEESEKHPEALITSYPEYDESVPQMRLKARNLSNTWVHILTLSKEIPDGLIGFRVYPVAPYYSLIRRHAIIDSHMAFDPEIIIRYRWLGIQVINHPVKVIYPENGVSNFRAVRDTIHLSLTFTRLSFTLILQSPFILPRLLLSRNKK